MSLLPAASWALGLGRLNVQSALGEALRAEIDVTSLTSEEAATLQVKVASPETYRAAGVDYNQVLGATSIALQRRTDGRAFLRIASDHSVQEPFVDVILDLAWSSGRLVREYTLLFAPPSTSRACTRTRVASGDAVTALSTRLATIRSSSAASARTGGRDSGTSTSTRAAPSPSPRTAVCTTSS